MPIKLFVCGDVVNYTNNQAWLSMDLQQVIKNCDFAVANFEAPIDTEQMQSIVKAGPHVYQSPQSIDYLKQAGFTHVSLANNHIYDYGERAFKNTLSMLVKNDLGYVGAGETFAESYQPRILEKDGVKIGLLAACENEFGCHYDDSISRSGYAYLFHSKLEDAILAVKQQVDFVVLIAHAGVENIPIPIKEWRDRYHRLCDLGVDVIVGHHPHVPQGYEQYGKSLIFYSLGNFYFDTPAFAEKSDDSYSLVLEFEKQAGVSFDAIYHKKIDGTTKPVPEEEVNFNLDHLSALLGEGYAELNDQYALETYNAHYKKYYQSAAGVPNSFKFKVKKMIKIVLGRKSNSEQSNGLLLLHNIRIDSHRFTVQRALSLKYEDNS
ncbi:CapA family protein [Marinomonas sp.]|uniref:CapA family protein n=1 Tax=Marinomonas sp. TaxID=1904862 RepID=UPI003F98D6A6